MSLRANWRIPGKLPGIADAVDTRSVARFPCRAPLPGTLIRSRCVRQDFGRPRSTSSCLMGAHVGDSGQLDPEIYFRGKPWKPVGPMVARHSPDSTRKGPRNQHSSTGANYRYIILMIIIHLYSFRFSTLIKSRVLSQNKIEQENRKSSRAKTGHVLGRGGNGYTLSETRWSLDEIKTGLRTRSGPTVEITVQRP